ncbi:MAG: signal peptide peptidase SppA [Bacillota bacterium]
MVRHNLATLCIVTLMLIPAMRSAAKDNAKADDTKPTIAVFSLAGPITESPIDNPLPLFAPPGTSLKDLVTRMQKAADDPSVRAVLLLTAHDANIGPAQAEELRQAIRQIRSAGKDVYVHADELHLRDYLLFSNATRISMVPTGTVLIAGLHADLPYLRGLLDKIGVKPDFYTSGEYKTAAEVFMRDGPSPQADQMQNWLLDGMYDTFVKEIAEGRGVDGNKVRGWIDAGLYTAEQAKAAGIIDAIESIQDLQAILKGRFGDTITFERKYGKTKLPQLDLSSPFAVFKFWSDLLSGTQKAKPTKGAIAIVYVDGPIMVGSKRDTSPLFTSRVALSTEIRRALDKAAADDSIKAVVLRIDSPGGSATASEIILDAANRVKSRKPLVVSMGNIAASGGYYVATGADTIFADSNTITASIGVVTGKLVTTGLWNKIGITFKEYKRGKNAGILSTTTPFSDDERARIQGLMAEIYQTFQGHVTSSRGNRLKKPIDQIAGGRVFTGQQALELGLVDKIGSLHDAIRYVAGQAKITDYDLRVLPQPKNLLEQILDELTGNTDDSNSLTSTDESTLRINNGSLLNLATPYLQHLDPHRVSVIQRLLLQLQMLQQEGVLLAMPEFILDN